MKDVCDTNTSESSLLVTFPFFVCPVPNLRKLTGFIKFEEARKRQILRVLTSGKNNRVLFASHKWLRPGNPGHPDDSTGSKFQQLIDIVNNDQFSLLEYVWVDYLCVPQEDQKPQQNAINSLPYYVSQCSSFVMLCCSQSGTGEARFDLATIDKYNSSGWCRLERLTALTVSKAEIYVHFKEDSIHKQRLCVAQPYSKANPSKLNLINPLRGVFREGLSKELGEKEKQKIAQVLLSLTKNARCPFATQIRASVHPYLVARVTADNSFCPMYVCKKDLFLKNLNLENRPKEIQNDFYEAVGAGMVVPYNDIDHSNHMEELVYVTYHPYSDHIKWIQQALRNDVFREVKYCFMYHLCVPPEKRNEAILSEESFIRRCGYYLIVHRDFEGCNHFSRLQNNVLRFHRMAMRSNILCAAAPIIGTFETVHHVECLLYDADQTTLRQVELDEIENPLLGETYCNSNYSHFACVVYMYCEFIEKLSPNVKKKEKVRKWKQLAVDILMMPDVGNVTINMSKFVHKKATEMSDGENSGQSTTDEVVSDAITRHVCHESRQGCCIAM